MARRKAGESKVAVGNIREVSGEVNIAAGDIHKGFTAEQVSALLTQITSTFQATPFDGRCPYKGLDVFEEEDAELFFGREKLIDDLINRVQESRTVFITGPSGSGKSSLVRAGLIHALKQGAIKDYLSERWLYETIEPGRDPIDELALAFSRLKSPELANYFRGHVNETNILHKCAESVLSGRGDQRLVLFIDQFEEVFTQVGKEKAEVFINILTNATTVENGRVILLFSMRSDFVSNCATYPQLNDLLNQQFMQVGAMQPDELVSAIAQPALRVGLRIDPDLIAQIINDMQGEPGALPLMQFALKDLFDSQQAKGGVITLTLNDYLQRGGIHKALERHADKSFAKLNESEQELARSIFSGLIEIGRGPQDTRRTALFDELIPASANTEDVESIVRKLADARLITTDENTVTLAHEKLIDAWPWLKKLVNENRDVIALQNEIAEDAKEWDEHKRDASYLYVGARLASAREQLEASRLALSGLAQLFIEAGIIAHADELEATRQRATQLRRRSAYLTVALVAALIAVGIAVFFSVQSRQQTSIAQAANMRAFEQQGTAQANADKAQQQAEIALARQISAQAQPLFANGNSKQMTAVLLAIQSMRMFPAVEAAQILQNNTLAHPVAHITHDDAVWSVAFSPDGKYVVSGSYDKTARVWEASTGIEISRMTHDGTVYSVVFSPAGRYVVSGSDDKTARVWEASTGIEISRMTHENKVNSVAFSPDGKYVVSGSNDKTARAWEASTGKEIARMTHNGGVSSVAFSPDGKYIVSGSYDGTIYVWEAATGKEIAPMTHDLSVNAVAFSPDGKYVVSGSSDHTARVWEAATGKEIARMTHDDEVNSVAFSLKGRYVVSGSWDNTARVWEAVTGKEIARMTHDNWVYCVAFSPDGNYVVSGSYNKNGPDQTARVWEATTGKEIARMSHDWSVFSVAFSPDGKYVVSGSDDNTARVWEAGTGKEIVHIKHDEFVNSVAFSTNGKYVVSGGYDNTARVWEVSTGREISRMTHENEVKSVAFSPNGKYVISGGCDLWNSAQGCTNGSARVWEASTGKEIARMTHDGIVYSVVFSPDGKYVVSGSNDMTARVWEATTGKEIVRMTHNGGVSSVAFSPDGKYIVSGSYDGTIYVWEASTEKEFAHITHGNYVNSIAFSPDGKYVVSGGDKTARVWEVATGTEIAHMTHDDSVTSVAFSPDGKYVVSGGFDNARVWEVTTGKEIARMTHDWGMSSVVFSPDGKYVVSGGYDNTARVWEASTGKEIARIMHDGLVTSVAFSPDGRYVVSGSRDKTVRVWIYLPDDLITQACSRVTRNLTRAEWNQYIGDALPYQAVCPNLPIEPEATPTPESQ